MSKSMPVSDEMRLTSSHGEVRVHRHGKGKLATKTFLSNDDGFCVTNVIIMGEEKCAIFDSQWTIANAYRALAEIVEENLTLETIYLSHAHPDHYFGSWVFKKAFPEARVIAVPEEAKIMTMQWTPKNDEVVPEIGKINYVPRELDFEIEPYYESYFEVEGHRVEIIDRLMGDYRYNTACYIPEISTICCSDIVFNEAHPFTCEVTREERAEWIDVLNKIEDMDCDVVIPGHAKFGMPFDNSGLDWTRRYIEQTEIELDRCHGAGEFYFNMDRAFKNCALTKSNEMNAMVFFGGRTWDWREDDVWAEGEKE